MRNTFQLRLAYAGDYPGHPVAWLNEVPLIQDDQINTLLTIMGVSERGWHGLRKLFDSVGAKRISGSEEHEPWEGTVTVS